MRKLLASTLCLLALQMGCSEERTWQAVHQMIEARYPQVPSLTTDSLAGRLSSDTTKTPLLLDARSPDEYAVSHLPGAHRVDPSATSFPALDTLSEDAPIVVYCSVGYRSARLVHRLHTQGFTNVSNLEGSIFQWANEGRRVPGRSEGRSCPSLRRSVGTATRRLPPRLSAPHRFELSRTFGSPLPIPRRSREEALPP